MFNNILVAVDGSENSKKALNYALELAEKFDGKITLIHVYSSVAPVVSPGVASTATPTVSPTIAAEIIEEAKHRGKKILDEAEQVAKERRISVEEVLREGNAVQEIVTVAKEGKFDIIIVGHRGLSKLEELFLGAVSEGVSHKAPCPVMIVK